MADTGWLAAGTGANDTIAGIYAWTNPGNITADDATRATASDATFNYPFYLRASNFGFTLPAGATIVGIEVRVQKHMSAGGDVHDNNIRLFNASGVPAGDDKANFDLNLWTTTVDTVVTYGGPTDRWGLTPTKSDVENANWGWGLIPYIAPLGATAFVDLMEMKVYYSIGSRSLLMLGVR